MDILEIEASNAEKAIELQKQQQQALAEAQKQYASQISSSIDTLPSTPTRKSQLKALMMAPIKDGNTTTTKFSQTLSKVYANPQHITQLADILLDYDETKGFTFEKQKRASTTSEVDEFKKMLKQVDSSKTSSFTKKPTNFDWDKFLENT
jgi:chemotaxis protein CheY-P-specific phosphatase CheC